MMLSKIRSPLWILFAVTLLASSCNDITKPKTLGSGRLDLGAGGGGNNSGDQATSFRFNFAMKDGAAQIVYLQGAANTKTGLVSVCSSSGASCACEFMDSSYSVLETTTAANITYDTTANYYSCTYTGASWASVEYVKLRNTASTVTSSNLEVKAKADLTLTDLLGTDLDANKARKVSRYTCEMNFLQKHNTTSTYFDCSAQAANPCTGANDFCVIKGNVPYFLYEDNLSNNFSSRPTDKIYNGNGGSNLTCGIQLFQYDCRNNVSVTPIFGIYATQSGYFDTSVSLIAGPDISSASYGYAAAYNTTTSKCPPGLDPKVVYTATVSTVGIESTNLVNGTQLFEINAPSLVLPTFIFEQWSGGSCNGTACAYPFGAQTNASYLTPAFAEGTTKFCVIPSSLLP